jgi:hypothetical protein
MITGKDERVFWETLAKFVAACYFFFRDKIEACYIIRNTLLHLTTDCHMLRM